MKCEKVIVLKVYSSEDTDGAGQDATLEQEVHDGALKLTHKLNNKQIQAILNMNIRVSKGAEIGVNDFSCFRISAKKIQRIQEFAAGSDDLGMYILAHCDHGELAGGLRGSELGKLINSLEIKIKKINLVACNAAEKQSGQTDSALLDFCKALTLNPKPIVAGYGYPVFIADGGDKIYTPKGPAGLDKVRVKDALNAGKKIKVAYRFDKGKWAKVDLETYRQ